MEIREGDVLIDRTWGRRYRVQRLARKYGQDGAYLIPETITAGDGYGSKWRPMSDVMRYEKVQ